jgi:hypothetical protein
LGEPLPGSTVEIPEGAVFPGNRLKITFNQIDIVGPGADILAINAHDASRVLNIKPGSVSLTGIKLTGGKTTGNGGGILAEGDLSLSSVAVVSNEAATGGGIYAGTWVPFFFGTVYHAVNLTIVDSYIAQNSARGSLHCRSVAIRMCQLRDVYTRWPAHLRPTIKASPDRDGD